MQQFACPACGGDITFNATQQSLVCPYCDTQYEAEAMAAMLEQSNAPQTDAIQWDHPAGTDWQPGETENLFDYVCSSCAGQITAARDTAATLCPYCGGAVVFTAQLSGVLRPDWVIPFRTDAEAAKTALAAHFKGKKLLPKAFAAHNHLDTLQGIYVPYWLFSAQTGGVVHYNAEKTRHWSDSQYTYTEKQHYMLTRSGEMAFDNVPTDASKSMPNDLMDSLEPYNCAEAVDFATAYLAGYLADKYDDTLEDCTTRVNARIFQSLSDTLRGTAQGYSSVQEKSRNLQVEHGTVRYALLPVWLLRTTWQGKNFLFAMNGQTGKMVGDLPCDWKAFWQRLTAWTVGLSAALAVLFFFTARGHEYVSILIGLGVALGVVLTQKGKLKSVRQERTAQNYVRAGSFKLTGCSDVFLYRRVSKVKRSSK